MVKKLILIPEHIVFVNTDSSYSSSSSDSEEDDDDTDQNDRKATTAKDKQPKSTKQQIHQKSPEPENADKQQKSSTDGPKYDGGIERGTGRSQTRPDKSYRRDDRPLYQSPGSYRADSLQGQVSDVRPPRSPLNRSQSFEQIDLDKKDSLEARNHPRHASSPGRLACIPSDQSPNEERTADWAKRHFECKRASSPSQRRHRSQPPPPPNRRSPSSRFHSPASKRRSQSDNKSPVAKRKMPISEYVSQVSSRPPVRSPNAKPINRRQPERIKSPSPSRQPEKSRNETFPPNRRQGNRLPPRLQSRKDGNSTGTPWYACSSPPRSGDLIQDKTEDKQHNKMALSSQPLMIATEDLKSLVRKLGAPIETREIQQVPVDNSGDNKKVLKTSDATDPNTKAPPAADTRCDLTEQHSKVIKKPPGLRVPSEISPDVHPNVEPPKTSPRLREVPASPRVKAETSPPIKDVQASPAVRDEQRQVKTSGLGNLHVTVTGAGSQAAVPKGPLGSNNVPVPESTNQKVVQQIGYDVRHSSQSQVPLASQKEPSTPVLQQISVSAPVVESNTSAQPFSIQDVINQPLSPVTQETSSINSTMQPATQPPVQVQAAKATPPQTAQPLPKMLPMVLKPGSVVNVAVSEIQTPGSFYIQIADNSPLEQLMNEIR